MSRSTFIQIRKDAAPRDCRRGAGLQSDERDRRAFSVQLCADCTYYVRDDGYAGPNCRVRNVQYMDGRGQRRANCRVGANGRRYDHVGRDTSEDQAFRYVQRPSVW